MFDGGLEAGIAAGIVVLLTLFIFGWPSEENDSKNVKKSCNESWLICSSWSFDPHFGMSSFHKAD